MIKQKAGLIIKLASGTITRITKPIKYLGNLELFTNYQGIFFNTTLSVEVDFYL